MQPGRTAHHDGESPPSCVDQDRMAHFSREAEWAVVEAVDSSPPSYTFTEPHRFFLLVVGSAGCILASICYTFNIFAYSMMKSAHLSMGQLSTVGTVMLVFCYFTLPYAYVYDRFGPRSMLAIGTTLLTLGCLLMGLTFQGTIQASETMFAVFCAIMGGGCIVFDIGSVVSVLSWFPTSRGPVVAVMKSFAGLGTAIMGTIQLAFFDNRMENYFFFLTVVAFVFGTTCTLTMKLPPYHLTGYEEAHLSDDEKKSRLSTKKLFLVKKPPRWRLLVGFLLVLFLIVFLPLQSALISYLTISHTGRLVFASIVIATCLSFTVICFPFHSCAKREQTSVEDDEPVKEEKEEHDAELTEILHIAPQFQTTFIEGLSTFRLWCVFLSCFAIIGAQLVIIFQATFIINALSGTFATEDMKTLLTVLSGVGSAVGRLLASWFDIWSQHREPHNRIPITWSLFFSSAFNILGLVFFLALPAGALPAAYVFVAMGNGAGAAASVIVLRTIFAKDPAMHYNFGFLAVMISAVLLNRVAFGVWYDSQVTPENSVHGVCLDRVCVLMPLLLLLGINVLAVFSTAYLHRNYAAYSRRLVAAHLEKQKSLEVTNSTEDTLSPAVGEPSSP